MSERENFFNIDALEQGISRQLAEGMTTRIFPGKDAMISIVRIEPNRSGKIHSHPQEQWGFVFTAQDCEFRAAKSFLLWIPVKLNAHSGEVERWNSPSIAQLPICRRPGTTGCRQKLGVNSVF